MKRPELVIFDCDGVLVDSEPIANRVLVELIGESGRALTHEDSERRFRGRRMDDVMQQVEALTGRALPADWLATFEQRRNAAFQNELQAVAGVHGALETLAAAGIASCVASSASVAKMRLTLGLTGLAGFFGGRLYSAWDVPRGKPFPDVFLSAAAAMNRTPPDCVVIEDSAPGAAAAQAAGMRCLGYAAAGGQESLQAHDAECFFDMNALPSLLGIG